MFGVNTNQILPIESLPYQPTLFFLKTGILRLYFSAGVSFYVLKSNQLLEHNGIDTLG